MDLIAKFLNTLRIQNYSKDTVKLYGRWLKGFSGFLGKPIETATSDDIVAYMTSRTTDSSGTRKTIYIALQSFFTWMLESDIIQKKVRVPVVKADYTVVKVLQPETIRRILNSIELKTIQDYRDKALIEFMYVTGMRISEILGLQQGDISTYKLFKASKDKDRHCKVLIRGKGHKEREIYVNSISAEILYDYLGQRNDTIKTVFIAHEGKKQTGLSKQRVRTILVRRAALARVSKHVHPHLLRHSIATHMLEAGVNVFTLQKFLGHSRIESTKRYISLLDHDYRKVCEGTIRAILYK